MITWLQRMMDCRRRRVAAGAYQDGYDRAAGCLLQGVSPDNLEAQVDGIGLSANVKRDGFDIGWLSACRDWRKRELP